MPTRLLPALALVVAAAGAGAQEPDQGPYYGLVEHHEPDAGAAPVRLSLEFISAKAKPNLRDLQLLDEDASRLWGLLGPFETPDQAVRTATPRIVHGEIGMDIPDVEVVSEIGPDALAAPAEPPHPVAAELIAGAAPLDAASDAAPPHHLLWRLRFHDGSEARGTDIVRDQLVPAMASAGSEPLLLRLIGDDWDLLVIDGPFATAEDAQARIDRRDIRYEAALVAHIGDPRTVAATRDELALLAEDEEQRVAARVVGEPE